MAPCVATAHAPGGNGCRWEGKPVLSRPPNSSSRRRSEENFQQRNCSSHLFLSFVARRFRQAPESPFPRRGLHSMCFRRAGGRGSTIPCSRSLEWSLHLPGESTQGIGRGIIRLVEVPRESLGEASERISATEVAAMLCKRVLSLRQLSRNSFSGRGCLGYGHVPEAISNASPESSLSLRCSSV